MVGILSTALLISILTQKLVLSRWEKYVYHLILNLHLTKEEKHQAANVIKFAIKFWLVKKLKRFASFDRMKFQWKLFRSIQHLQQIKLDKRNCQDQCLVLPDLYNLQLNQIHHIETIEHDIKSLVHHYDEKLNQIQQTLDHLIRKTQ